MKKKEKKNYHLEATVYLPDECGFEDRHFIYTPAKSFTKKGAKKEIERLHELFTGSGAIRLGCMTIGENIKHSCLVDIVRIARPLFPKCKQKTLKIQT